MRQMRSMHDFGDFSSAFGTKFQFQSSGFLRILAAEQALCVRITGLMYLAFTKGADVEFAKAGKQLRSTPPRWAVEKD